MDVHMPQRVVDLMDLSPFEEGTDSEVFRILREHDPLHWNDEADGPGFWSVTRYGDVKAVASDYETFTATEGTQIKSRRAGTNHRQPCRRHAGLAGERCAHERLPRGAPLSSSAPVPGRQISVDVNPDRSRLGVLVHRLETHLPAVAGNADAAER